MVTGMLYIGNKETDLRRMDQFQVLEVIECEIKLKTIKLLSYNMLLSCILQLNN